MHLEGLSVFLSLSLSREIERGGHAQAYAGTDEGGGEALKGVPKTLSAPAGIADWLCAALYGKVERKMPAGSSAAI